MLISLGIKLTLKHEIFWDTLYFQRKNSIHAISVGKMVISRVIIEKCGTLFSEKSLSFGGFNICFASLPHRRYDPNRYVFWGRTDRSPG